MQVVSHQKEERGLMHGFIWPIVVSKFCHRKIGHPNILTLVCPETKILLQPLVCLLRLLISVWVIRCKDVMFNAQYVAQFPCKSWGKVRVPVTDDLRQEFMRGEYVLSIECGCFFSIDFFSAQDEV